MGGAEIMLDGAGFDDTPQSNLIMFNSHNTGFESLVLDAPSLKGKLFLTIQTLPKTCQK